MPEAVIVSAARSPIGRANKGSLQGLPPRRPGRHHRPGRAGQDPGARPARRSTTSTSAAACPAASRATTWAASSTCSTAWTPCPAPRSPATAPRRCRPPGWRSTRSRPARATCSSPPASRRSPASPRAPPTTAPDTQNPLFDGRPGAATDEDRRRAARTGTTRARTACCPTSTSRWARPPRTSPGCAASTARSSTSSASARRTSPRRPSTTASGPARSPRSPRPTARSSAADDGPRAGVTYEAVSELKPVFRPDGVGHRRQLLPAQRRRRRGRRSCPTPRRAELGLTPLARIVSTGVTGLSPEIMGLGPVEATKQALANAGMSIGDIDLVEINEAFAAQVVPSYQDLGIDLDRLNVNGGAIAVGHPFGMTGARLQNTMLNSLRLARQDHRPDHHVRRRRPGHGADPRAALSRVAGPRPERRRRRRSTGAATARVARMTRTSPADPWLDAGQQRSWRALVLGTHPARGPARRRPAPAPATSRSPSTRSSCGSPRATAGGCGWPSSPTPSRTAAAGSRTRSRGMEEAGLRPALPAAARTGAASSPR